MILISRLLLCSKTYLLDVVLQKNEKKPRNITEWHDAFSFQHIKKLEYTPFVNWHPLEQSQYPRVENEILRNSDS